jgi:hypothetical protein
MKEMLTKTITVRVSAEVKAEFDQIRGRVDAAGFDVGATLRDTISNTRQIRNELDAIYRKTCRRRALAPACSGIRDRIPASFCSGMEFGSRFPEPSGR